MPKATCSVDGCERPHRARGFCAMHYARWNYSGDPGVADRKNFPLPLTCTVEGCDLTAKAKGLCGTHWTRQYRHGDPGAAEISKAREGCQIQECDREHTAMGFCEMHYLRWRKHGDASRVDPARWFGDQVGYIGVHQRIYKLRGRAAEHGCELCSRSAAEWAYDHADPNERLDEKRGPYSIDPTHYRPLCLSCHRTFDAPKEDHTMRIPVEDKVP